MTSNDTLVSPIPPIPAVEVTQPALRPVTEACAHGHLVQFYERDDVLLDSVAAFIGEALRDGRPGVLVATRQHRADIEQRLRLAGIDTTEAMRRGAYVALDAAEMLARFMVERLPDRALFKLAIEPVLGPAIARNGHAHVFGEMVAVLVEEGNYPAAIALEELWNELQTTLSFSLLCGYPMRRGGAELTEMFATVIAAHTRVAPAESYSGLTTDGERQREIALLQQKALWLEREAAERKHAEERLRFALASEQAARRETEAALRLRDEFLSIAAHELKTPLTGLHGHVQLALRTLDRHDDGGSPLASDRIRRSLGVVGEQARKLSMLLDQLLDTSRLEAGRLTIETQTVDLAALVQQVTETARIVSSRNPIIAETPAALEAEVDPLRLEQVLTNLLDNAIRHSPEGRRIDVRLAQPSPELIELSVRDQGPGVPPEQRERIFDRYYRLESDVHTSGLGLGLYICSEIVDLHGGSLRVECPPEGGSLFIASLPVREGRPPRLLHE